MRQIRIGTFETNSSSVHSLVILEAEDFAKWKSGDFVLDVDDKVKTKELLYAAHKETVDRWHDGNVEDYISDEKLDYNSFFDRDMETFIQRYKTKSGEEVVAFGYYGYDG